LKPKIPYQPFIVPLAHKLRKTLTYSERILWNHLKGKALMQYDFHRQKPVLTYVVDFYCPELMLAIEVDGSSHIGNEEKDALRQKVIEERGIRFLRFDGLLVRHQPEVVVNAIVAWIVNYEEKYGIPEIIVKRRERLNGEK
jgi:very-short-patch-repair endonuclease